MKETLVAGAMALALLGQQSGGLAGVGGSSQQQAGTAGQKAGGQAGGQQAIPDAPKPQTVPLGTGALGTVAPGKGTTASSSGGGAAAGPDQPAVGTALPDSPTQPLADREAGAPPDQPGPGDYPAYVLPRLTVNFVDIPFTVKDSKGHLVPGLDWRDVRVFENGTRQHMQVFTRDPAPMSVALVIDQSLPFDTMKRVNDSLGALTGAFAPYDEVALFTYNNGPQMRQGFTAGQSALLGTVIERSKTTGREAMYYAPGEGLGGGININNGADENITPLTSHAPGGPNRVPQVPRDVHTLNDAILAAAISLSHVPEPRRRIIYVISDGKEYGSTAKQKDVIRYLETNKISVYATITGDSSITGLGFLDKFHLPLQMRDNILPQYVNATGGQAFAEYKTKAIETSFAQITEQIRTQYTVGYYSREPFIDGKYRKIEVQVMRPNLQVIAKDGYYPTPERVRPPVGGSAGTGKAQAPLQP